MQSNKEQKYYEKLTSSGMKVKLSREWFKKLEYRSITDSGRQLTIHQPGTNGLKQLARVIHGEEREGWYVRYKDGDRFNLLPDNLYSSNKTILQN